MPTTNVIKNNHKYQYFIDEVAGLLKSGNKKVVTSHFASKQKWCDIEQKWCDLKQKWSNLEHEWHDLE